MNTALNFSIIQNITQGEWISEPTNQDETLVGGTFDSRNIGEADIFFAWKGEKGDGHTYLHTLKGTDIKLVIVEKDVPLISGISILKVENSLAALQKIAKYLAKGFSGKIISITGSCGKTTAKTWLNHILDDRFNILTNIGSFNNHIGCPITILNIRPEHDLMILEMGTSGLGELELLSSIAPADITVLLNVGHAHMGKMGSIENTYKAKMEIFSYQREGAISILPEFDPKILGLFQKETVEFFGSKANTFNWERKKIDGNNFMQVMQFGTSKGKIETNVNQLGDYVGDLLSALIAICDNLGISAESIVNKFATLPQEKGRLTPLVGLNGVKIIDDTYNANPESVVNMLNIICSMKADKYIGVVGNLAEMDEGLKDSIGVIKENLPTNLTHLFLEGETAVAIKNMVDENFPNIQTYLITSFEETFNQLKGLTTSNTVMGIKGSRSSHMERYVYALSDTTPVKCHLQKCGLLKMCKLCEKLF